MTFERYLCRYNSPSSFTSGSNYLTPSPNWSYKPNNLDRPISTTPPSSESDKGSVNFGLWKELGKDILVKNNINNWITCSENGGSIVDNRSGPISCNVTKVIVEGQCEDVVPFVIEKHGASVSLSAQSGMYYNLYTGDSSSWPVSDPCGAGGQRQLTEVEEPGGWLYVREPDPFNPQVIEVFDTKNESGKLHGSLDLLVECYQCNSKLCHKMCSDKQ